MHIFGEQRELKRPLAERSGLERLSKRTVHRIEENQLLVLHVPYYLQRSNVCSEFTATIMNPRPEPIDCVHWDVFIWSDRVIASRDVKF